MSLAGAAVDTARGPRGVLQNCDALRNTLLRLEKKRAPKRPQAGEKAAEPGTGRLPQTQL